MSYVNRYADPITRTPLHRVVIAAVVLAMVTIGWARPVGGTDSGSDARLKSVQFDLVDQADVVDIDGPLGAQGVTQAAQYRTLIVGVDGADAVLRPLDSSVRIAVDEHQLVNMAAERNGQQIGHSADGFANLLADVISSTSAHSFARLESQDSASSVAFDLSYDRPLDADDYLLVQEGGGDAIIEIASIDSAGAAIGSPRQVGPGYQWNTGHGPLSGPTAWASVIPVASLSPDGQAVVGLRVSSANAQVKVIALTAKPPVQTPPPALAATEAATPLAAASSASSPTAASTTDGSQPTTGGLQPEIASIGLQTKIQPAISVGGTTCMDGPATDPANLTTGEAATFCFIVTNHGSTNLTNIAITDELLGLSNTVLPKAAGPDVLKPGEQAAFYYHTVLAARPAKATSSVTASVVDGSGAPLPGAAVEYVEHTAEPVAQTLIESTVEPAPAPAASVSESAAPAVTQLAMTGVPTEPWILVIFAMAFIFFGYTAYAAFQKRTIDAEPSGHEQLDSLGFE